MLQDWQLFLSGDVSMSGDLTTSWRLVDIVVVATRQDSKQVRDERSLL